MNEPRKGVNGDPAAGGGGTGAPEIEVTPEMIEAGINAIGPFDLEYAFEGGYSEKAELVTQIYQRMAISQRLRRV